MSEAAAAAQPRAFQAEVSRLLHLMVHSVYTEKEIFLRELISNASDACDKLRYEAIAKPELAADDQQFRILIKPDKAARTLTITDNGIGMSEAELVDNLGTIARSGTKAFLDRLAAEKDGSNALIGQFGVGFYSAFMVADRIEVVSRRAGQSEAWAWSSDGSEGFTVTPVSDDRAAGLKHGTSVLLKLKDDADKFLEPYTIEQIVKTYSDHILFPVEIEEDGKTRQLNSASALWQRSKSEVKPEEYKEVYNTVAGQYDDPAVTLHYKAEGRQAYAVLLFVPSTRPFDIYDADRKGRVKLYVRRVFITEDAELLPRYLRFVRGVIDSEDVPLNISREMLQNNPMVAQIRRAVTGRVLTELETIAEKEPERFAKIWETFSAVIKEGLYEDFERRDQLLKFARFRSTKTGADGWRSLSDYVADMRPGQTEIYFLAGESLDRLKASPQLEAAAARDVEVLLLADPVDSFWTTVQPKFAEKAFRSLSQGDADLSAIPLIGDDKPAEETAELGALVTALKSALGDAVSDVKASKRLVSSAACLVAPGSGPDLALDRLLQRRNEGAGVRPILEVNPSHPIVKAAAASSAAGRTDEVADLGALLLDQARILDGELPTDTAKFTERLNRLVVKGLGTSTTGG